jgi:hypothetical protein
MSLLDDVSIVVTPNGYKASTLYGVLPTYAEGSEEVTDGSNANAGANWNANSNWDKTVAGLFSCDGTTVADINQDPPSAEVGKQYILSFEVLSINVGGKLVMNFGGIVGTDRTAVGVYSETITATGTDRVRVRPNTAGTIGSVTGISVKEVTSADMDVTRATAATRVDEDGLIEDVLSNVPRIDYTGGGCPHILAEPQRTNLIPYSEDFSSWTTTSATLTPNQLSPDGTNNAYIIEDDNATGSGYEKVDVTITTTATPCTLSVFVKKKTSSVSTYSGIQMGTGFSYLIFDSYNGTYNQSSNTNYDSIEVENFNSDWWRLKLTATVTTSTRVALWGAISSNGTTISPSATGSETFWGAQLEQASYATSYIPNSGTAAGVTRNQDIFTRDGIGSLINSTEGVLFVEMAALADDETKREITLSDGSTVNYVLIRFNSGGSNRIYTRVDVGAGGGLQYYDLDTSHTITDVNKIAIRWGVSNFATFINGVKVGSQLSGSSFSADTLNELNFDNGTGGSPFNGKVKQLQVYDTALTDPQLISLTT